MSEPLKVILIVAGVFSGIYLFGLAKNIAATGQINPEYVYPVFLSFFSIFALGFLIWGIVALVQSYQRSKISHRTTAKNS